MAFSQPIWEVRTTGDDTNNGGGFDVNCTFPADGAATSATGASPVFSSASYTFVAGDVDAWIFIKSGTNWNPGWYKIASVSAGAATLDATAGHGVRFLSGLRGYIQGPTRVTGVATTASPTSATWGIDYSQQDSAEISFTDMVIAVTTTDFTSAGNPVGKNFIGNIISVTAGTGFTVQRVRVVSTSGTTATCDKSLGTAGSTGGTGRLGGALISTGLAASLIVGGDGVYVQSGSYTITSASTNVSGGCWNSNVSVRLEGYATVRGDMGTAPTLTASAISTFTVFNFGISNSAWRNMTVDGASLTSSRVMTGTASLYAERITMKNCTNTAVNWNNNGFVAVNCRATGCTGGSGAFFIGNGLCVFCVADANTIPGFTDNSNPMRCVMCLAASNTGGTTDGFQSTNTGTSFVNCVAYGNGRDGFRITGFVQVINAITEGNGGFGVNLVGAPSNNVFYLRSASFNDTSGASNNPVGVATATGGSAFDNVASLSVSPFVNAASGNFALNNSVGGGAALRAAGFPGALLFGGTGYLDIGVLQHQDGAGSISDKGNPFIGGFV